MIFEAQRRNRTDHTSQKEGPMPEIGATNCVPFCSKLFVPLERCDKPKQPQSIPLAREKQQSRPPVNTK